MNAKDVLQKYLDVDNTPMKGNEWIIDCMTEYAESLLPQWRPIEQVLDFGYNLHVVCKERERKLYKAVEITKHTK